MQLDPIATVPAWIAPGQVMRSSAPESRIGLVVLAERLLLHPGGAGLKTIRQAAACLRVGEKTIYNAFTTVHGISPHRYLTMRRLELVRDALLAEPDRRSAIKYTAISYGFYHLGNFARAYSMQFGELPSETVAGAKRKSSLTVA